MKDKLSVEWKEVLLTPDPTCKATVDGLKENQVVTFRVRAANKAGFGEPSEPTDTHVVKHRNRKLADNVMPLIMQKKLNLYNPLNTICHANLIKFPKNLLCSETED